MKIPARDCALYLAALLVSQSVAVDALSEGPSPARLGVAGQFSLELPQGWTLYDQAAAVSGQAGPVGIIVFAAEPLVAEGRGAADVATLARVDRGELASFFVDRKPAPKGTSCARLSKSAIYELGTAINKDPVLSAGRRHFAALAPRHDEVELGGCRGVRFLVEANSGDADRHWLIDVRAASDGRTLYLFSLRNPANNYLTNLAAFEQAIGSLRFDAATP